jgi:transposase InsO family protein
MSTAQFSIITTGTRVRIISPTVVDFTCCGVVTGVQHGESFFVRLDDGTMSGPYGATELESLFSTLRTADLLDALCLAVDAARVSAAGNTRWQNAINEAFNHILQVEVIEYRASDHALRYHSESGATYTANGRCQCKAYQSGEACKHRAAAKLVRRALEVAQVVPAIVETAEWAANARALIASNEVELAALAALVAPAPRSRFASAGKSAQQEIDELYA